MPSLTTVEQLKSELGKPGTLSVVLLPDHFASPGAVADAMVLKAKEERRELKPTQIRRIFTTIKQLELAVKGQDSTKELESETLTRLRLLEPELAYAVGRQLIPQDFFEVLRLCLRADKMKTVADLRRLVEFLSAIIAYQKFRSQ